MKQRFAQHLRPGSYFCGFFIGYIWVGLTTMIWVNTNPRSKTPEMSHEHNPHQN